eukprot:TRINITY_DN1857_c0_g1_i1.p1 TRINITY_DN1857_c0_g1~~TRINITY_DN1857_c0_g1_i1.p1  ORF type:complete len:506 (-),score=69.81 TRINITY_DN1857_c0_g1_i1:24-1541(-)
MRGNIKVRFLALVLLFVAVMQTANSSAVCPSQLPNLIDNLLSNSPITAQSRWGIYVEEINNQTWQGKPLYSRDAINYFLPASTNKVLTSGSALLSLGPDYTIKTDVTTYTSKITAASSRSTVDVLIITGRGDPSMTFQQLDQLASQLSQSGITTVNFVGVDQSYFKQLQPPSTWDWGDLTASYGALPTPFVLNENVITFSVVPPSDPGQNVQVKFYNSADQDYLASKLINSVAITSNPNVNTFDCNYLWGTTNLKLTGTISVGAQPFDVSIAVADTAIYFQKQFVAALKRSNIQVTNQNLHTLDAIKQQIKFDSEEFIVQSGPAITSPSLYIMMNNTLQWSVNLEAEMWLRHLGVNFISDPTLGEVDNGLAKVRSVLTNLGVDGDLFIQADGSGLSRKNLISPKSLVVSLRGLLQKAPSFVNILPVAGESGTLKNRFIGTPAQGVVFAKTGSLSDTYTLAGYVLRPNQYNPIVFSVMVNQNAAGSGPARALMDQIVVLLAQLQNC